MTDVTPEEYWFTTSTGLNVHVRAERPEDAGHLIDLFEHLGTNSRFMRFSKVLDHPDPQLVRQEAERLAKLEPPRDMAWLAFADLPGEQEEPVAGARYVRLPDDPLTAEVAISVRDDLQRQGIGSQLLRFIAEHARQHGVQRLVASFRSENRAIWALLKHTRYPVTYEVHGPEVHAVVDLTSPLQPS